jgi:hypothetical protein
MSDSHDFYWYSDDGESSIVVRHQPATAVYTNPHGEVVIRQQDQYGDEDNFVYVTKDNALKVAQAILSLVGIEVALTRLDDGRLDEPLLLSAPKDKTAAARMRRYRKKKRDADRNTVTDEPELRLVAGE